MYETIDIHKFKELLGKERINLIDVREEDEFMFGHLPQAENMPLSRFLDFVEELYEEETYYVICHSGARSANACAFLASQGYHVVNVEGGMAAL